MSLTASTIAALGRVRQKLGMAIPEGFHDCAAAGSFSPPEADFDAPNYGMSEKTINLMVSAYRVQYGRDPVPMPKFFKRTKPLPVRTSKTTSPEVPQGAEVEALMGMAKQAAGGCEIAIFDGDTPRWIDRWEMGDVDYKLSESISLRLEADRDGVMSWQLVGETADSAASQFFAGVRDSGNDIVIDAWADKELRCVLGHHLSSGELLTMQVSFELLRELLTTAPEGIDGIKRIEFWLENSCVQRSPSIREGFDKGSFYNEEKTAHGWERKVLFNGAKFIQ